MSRDGFYDPDMPVLIRRGDLPHWRQDGVIYFVTFRLGDSIPQATLARWAAELDEWRRVHPDATDEEIEQDTLRRRRRFEKWLDKGLGSCVLALPRAKAIVETSLRHFDGSRYTLLSSTVAPNHVHTLVRPAHAVDLSDILYSWKRFSSGQMRKLPEVQSSWSGPTRHLWQTESFDHIVRSRSAFERFDLYIQNHDRQPKPR